MPPTAVPRMTTKAVRNRSSQGSKLTVRDGRGPATYGLSLVQGTGGARETFTPSLPGRTNQQVLGPAPGAGMWWPGHRWRNCERPPVDLRSGGGSVVTRRDDPAAARPGRGGPARTRRRAAAPGALRGRAWG